MIHIDDFPESLRMRDIMMDAPPPRRQPIDIAAELRKDANERAERDKRLTVAPAAAPQASARPIDMTHVAVWLFVVLVCGNVIAAMLIDTLVSHCLWPVRIAECSPTVGMTWEPSDMPDPNWMKVPDDGA